MAAKDLWISPAVYMYTFLFFRFLCGRMADAPFLMLSLHEDLVAWSTRDPEGAKAGLKKANLHAEYLTGRSVIFALASNKIEDATKTAMTFDRNAHIEIGKPNMPKVYNDSKLKDFISEESWLFFQVRPILRQ